MKVIFAGTPQFAVPTLEALAAAGFQIPLVITQPDRPKGRGMELALSPVKQAALKLNLPLLQPEKIKNNPEFRETIEKLAPDVIIVVGYGRIIPKWMLELPRFGNINLHASLLPKYRGAAPIQWAIANGETVTGNTTMLLNEGLDTGDILLQHEEPISNDDTALTLAPRLAASGAQLVIDTLRGLESGTIRPKPQDHSLATLAPILKKEDGRVDFSRPAPDIYNRFRGFQPWPGAFTTFRGRHLMFTRVGLAESADLSPGEIRAEKEVLLVGAADATALFVSELQPEGKKKMSARDFANGFRITSQEKFGA